jgi:hypothetical protein
MMQQEEFFGQSTIDGNDPLVERKYDELRAKAFQVSVVILNQDYRVSLRTISEVSGKPLTNVYLNLLRGLELLHRDKPNGRKQDRPMMKIEPVISYFVKANRLLDIAKNDLITSEDPVAVVYLNMKNYAEATVPKPPTELMKAWKTYHRRLEPHRKQEH